MIDAGRSAFDVTAPPGSGISRRALSPLIIESTEVSALGGLLFGFGTTAIAGTTRALEDLYGADTRQQRRGSGECNAENF